MVLSQSLEKLNLSPGSHPRAVTRYSLRLDSPPKETFIERIFSRRFQSIPVTGRGWSGRHFLFLHDGV